MTSGGWPLVEVAARLLEGDERNAVLGDLQEASETAWYGLFGVLGLVFRRHAQLWKSWRPWYVSIGRATLLVFIRALHYHITSHCLNSQRRCSTLTNETL